MSNTGSPRVVSRSRFDASGEFVRYVVVPVAACFVLLDKFDEGSVGLPDIGGRALCSRCRDSRRWSWE